MDLPETPRIGHALAATRLAYDGLVELGEEVEDEWSYVNDLAEAWRGRIDEVDSERGGEALPAAAAAALRVLVDEAAAIDDPHRAIDWLSTFPQVLLVALGERP